MSRPASSAGESGRSEPSGSAGEEAPRPAQARRSRSLSPAGNATVQALLQARRQIEVALQTLQCGDALQIEDEGDVGRHKHLLEMNKECLVPTQDQDIPRVLQDPSSCQESPLFWVVVDGPIGCGKTTFLRSFKNLPSVEKVVEPVAATEPNSWHDSLVALYKWIKGRAASGDNDGGLAWDLEQKIWKHHYENATRPRKTSRLTERSYEPKVHVFAKVICRRGLLKPHEYGSFVAAYEEVARNPKHKPDLVLKLNVPPAIAKRRIDSRAITEDRIFEKDIDLDYLESHSGWHELIRMKELTQEYDRLYLGRKEVINVNANEPMQDMITEVREKVTTYLQEHCPESKKGAIRAFLEYLQHPSDQQQ